MTLEDLADYAGEWVTPATTNYHGYDVFTLPPPAQTWAADEILNILETCVPKWAPGQTLATLGPASPKYWHLVVEAKKLAYADLYALQRRSQFRDGAARTAAVQSARRHRSAGASIRIARLGDRPGAPGRELQATPSCSRPPIDRATWWRGSTACSTASAPVSPCRATASPCTIAEGCSRWIRRARTSSRRTSVHSTRCPPAS